MKLYKLSARIKRVTPKLLLFLLPVTILLILTWLLVTNKFLRFEEITCVNSNGEGCPLEIINTLASIKKQAIFPGDVSGVLDSIKQRYPYIKNMSVQRRGLKTITIKLSIKKPAVAITNEAFTLKPRWYLLDNQGLLISESSEIGYLPKLYLNEADWKFSDHKLSTVYADRALPVLILLGEKFTGIDARISSFGDLEISISGLKALISLEKDPFISAATLQLLLAEPTIQDNKPKVVDLRFQNITLSY